MLYYIVKVLVTAVLVVFISELAKRSTLAGAILASVPLISVLAMMWLYFDTRDTTRLASLSGSIFWLVLPAVIGTICCPATAAKSRCQFLFEHGGGHCHYRLLLLVDSDSTDLFRNQALALRLPVEKVGRRGSHWRCFPSQSLF